MSFLDQITLEKRSLVEDLLKRGKYQLLLGAGASLDSDGGDGRPLPRSAELAAELNSISSSAQSQLTGAFKMALSRDSVGLDRFLQKRFTNCSPSDWWETALDCAWKRIWTLNIDDVVEQALIQHPVWNPHRYKSYSWHAPLQDFDGLQIVHLHGSSERDRADNLIFSIVQYAEATKREHGWHRKFFDEWTQDAFITIGAGLVQEYDLVSAIDARPATSSLPSLYVSPTINAEMREQLELANLIPVECNAGDFFSEVEEITRDARESIRYRWNQSGAAPEVSAAMAEQFEMLTTIQSIHKKDSRDFYRGDEPEWEDVLDSKAAILSWYKTLTDDAVASVESSTQRAFFLYSKKLAGRTVALLQISKLLIDEGCSVFWFRSRHRPEVGSIKEFLATRHRSILIFDNVADFADDVSTLISECAIEKIPCVVIASELLTRRKSVWNSFDMTHATDFTVPASKAGAWPLQHSDAESLVNKIEERGRFGVIRDLSHDERVAIFRNHEIFDGMSIAEYGSGFRDRVSKQLNEISGSRFRTLIGVVSILNLEGRSFPLSYVSAAGFDRRRLESTLKGPLGSVLRISGSHIGVRFRALTPNQVYSHGSKSQLFETLIELLTSISVYAAPEARRVRSEGYLVVRTLMRHGLIRNVFGREFLGQFYDRLAGTYGTDSRFWEQRARAAIVQENYTKAMSYAAKAVELSPKDSWRLTTYGDICLIRAAIDFPIGSPEFWDLYELGHTQLNAALLTKRENALPAILGIKRSIVTYREYLMSDRRLGTSVLNDLEIDIGKQIRAAYSLNSIAQTWQAEDVRNLEHEFLRLRSVKDSPEDYNDPNFSNMKILASTDEENVYA